MRRFLLAAAILLGIAAPAAAQLSSGAASAPNRSPDEIAAFAKKVEHTLAERGAAVALVARIGRDPHEMPAGMLYTHVGFWVYSRIATADGRTVPGYVAYNLYQLDEDGDHSELKQDFPFDFFQDVYELRAGIIIPSADMQRRILKTIDSPVYAKLHNPDYSVIANPVGDKYQNCTDFVLDIVMAGLYQTDDPRYIRSNIAAYFKPQVVQIGPGRALLGSLFVKGVGIADQGPELKTATFESIGGFMRKYRLADDVLEVSAQ